MFIQTLQEFTEFEAIRDNWDAVYAADPQAQFFLSWQWLFDWLTTHPTVWFVLAAKRSPADVEYVGFLPIRMRTDFDKQSGFYNHLYFAGDGYSDYTGMLVRPEFEAEIVAAFAEHLKKRLNWARFTIENLTISDHRRRLFLKAFDKSRFDQTAIDYKYPNDPTNHAICPSIDLPDRWDTYLTTLSTNNRQKIRRLLKKIDAPGESRITVSDAESFDFNLRVLLDFWKIKWAPSKGEDRAVEIGQRNYIMLTRCFEHGMLFLPVFWHGDKPVAALATLIDNCKQSFLFFIAGRDETYREMPAGYLLHAYSIRHAIARGFTSYDFLKGNEPYKYLFAPQCERRQRPVSIVTKTKRNLGGKLDSRGIPQMLEMTLEFEKQGEAEDTELGYRQILEVDPNNALALYRFGRHKAESGAHAEAKRLLLRSVEIDPEGDNAWFLLAQSLQFLGEDEAALAACREVLRLQPEHQEAKELLVQLSLTAKPEEHPPMAAVWPTKLPERAPDPLRPLAATAARDADLLLQKKVREIRDLTQDYYDRFVTPPPRW